MATELNQDAAPVVRNGPDAGHIGPNLVAEHTIVVRTVVQHDAFRVVSGNKVARSDGIVGSIARDDCAGAIVLNS